MVSTLIVDGDGGDVGGDVGGSVGEAVGARVGGNVTGGGMISFGEVVLNEVGFCVSVMGAFVVGSLVGDTM